MFFVVLMLTTDGITCCASAANDGMAPSICDSILAGVSAAKTSAPIAPPLTLIMARCQGRTRTSVFIRSSLE